MKFLLTQVWDIWTTLSGKANTVHTHVIADVTDSSVTGKNLVKAASVSDVKTFLGLGNVNNTADTAKPISTATQAALDTKPTLQNGKLPTSYLEQVNIGETYTVASESAMLALTVSPGDVAIRSDSDTLWMLKKSPASTKANWWDLTSALSGVAGVTSWNGQTGVVVASKGDVGLANADNTSDANKPVSTATQTALNAKQNAASAVSGSANGTATALTLWTGTQAQYNALGTKSNTTVYVVTA